ncbi:cation:proton antiporter [Pararcticibacter amylolyticus]|uniref:Sodium:proton antiporter n=1 Tax=Pararcticibacter amylolyticus TaxID=2173175 RepID=A0A2U2PFB7_9SPHI|nr:cation:proton antiporter [Pararcticibacter amylolyticus]PWG80098.1 sodium:proton antiporter [Pararcticibacter amylolyticus]
MSNSVVNHLLSEFQLPLKSPVLVFSVILFIILLAPLILGKIKVPGIIGFIVSGIVIGPNGFNVLEKNSAVNLFSTIGLLYIMFIAGLELDMNEFRKKKYKSFAFGFFTFIIPLMLGLPVCYYLLGFSWSTSILTASMFATHTLVAYPVVTRYGVSRNEAVAITVGGTILTDTAVLIILAVIMGSSEGSLNYQFWIQLVLSLALFSVIMFLFIPKITKWFFTRLESEKTSHYIFVLSVVFFAAFLAQLAGVEPIIGAFVAGLALNRLIPSSSSLMNRIEFTGNALFIPFFLISVGMIVDLRVLLEGPEALIVAGALTTVAISSKWLASVLTGAVFKYTKAQSLLIFGLSSAHAAATLAIILVGYNAGIIDKSILNGTIILILATCIVASFATEHAAKKIMATEEEYLPENTDLEEPENILVPIANFDKLEAMLDLAVLLKEKGSANPIRLLSVVHNNEDAENNLRLARKRLDGLLHYAAAAEAGIDVITTIDYNAASGVIRTAREKGATIIMSGWPRKTTFLNKFMGDKTETIIEGTDKNLFICHLTRPIAVHDRIVLLCPPLSESEAGFSVWLSKVCLLAKELSAPVYCYCNLKTQAAVTSFLDERKITAHFNFADQFDLEDTDAIKSRLKPDDLLVFVAARKESQSYQKAFDGLQTKLERYLGSVTKILVYPKVSVYSYEDTPLGSIGEL